MVRTWACPTGEEWDRYALGAPSAELEAHLRECPRCRLVVATKQREWNDLARAWHVAAGKGPIILFPLGDDASADLAPVRLAAQGDEHTPAAGAITLASPDRDIFLRAVRDPHTREVWLYLVAEKDPERCGQALIRLSETDTEYITDAQGRVNIGKIDLPLSEALRAEVHLPTAVFTLAPLAPMADRAGSVILSSARGDQIRVTWVGDGPHRRLEVEVLKLAERIADAPLKVAVRAAGMAGTPRLVSVSADRATVETGATPEALEIYFYQ